MALYRELAARLLAKEADRGVREQGWNPGPRVSEYQAADGLKLDRDTGYPWCMSLETWGFEKVGRPLIELHETASVGFALQYGTQHGWKVAKPSRADLILFYWGGPGDNWPDHVGTVLKVLPNGQLLTVEGNTSSDSAGSQDEGDGVFRKTRDPSKYRVAYLRVPGKETDPGPDYQVLRGRGPRQRVVAVAETFDGASKIMEKMLAKGATGASVRKIPDRG